MILISSSHVPAPLFFCSLHELPRILPIHEPPSGAASSSGTSQLLPAGLEVPHCTRGGDTAAGRQQGRAGATGLQQAGDGAGGGGRGLACSHLGRTLGARAALSQRAAGGAASVGEEGGQGRRHEHTKEPAALLTHPQIRRRTEGRRGGRSGEKGRGGKIASLMRYASFGCRWGESGLMLFSGFAGKRRLQESKNNQSLWVGFSIIFIQNPLRSGNKQDLSIGFSFSPLILIHLFFV